MSRITKKDVQRRIAGLDETAQRRVVCALVGHSRIQTHFFGYWYCARCEEQVGDSLAAVYDGANAVLVGHDCEVCRKNAATLTWRDTLLAPEPFPKTEGRSDAQN